VTATQLCGTPHHRHPETLCTEPAGHYRRNTDPHAGPLILDGRACGGAAWDEPKETLLSDQPGPRLTVDTITSDQLDALYERLEAAEQTESQRQLATAREALASATTRAARAEAAIARVRAVPRLPHTSQQTGDLGRAYTRGWESVISAIDAALDEPGPAAGGCSAPGPRTEPNNTSPA